MSWQMANRVASIAAAQAHGELGIDELVWPIDVASAIDAAGLELMYRPMPALFGAYLADAPVRGILVNSRMTRAVRRHTAAHELGHHHLGHGTVVDRGADDEASSGLAVVRGADGIERAAEAFATWFLMPLRTVRAALAACGFSPPLTAAQVYQLSLRLGTSYAATARHLVSLRMADSRQAQAWAAVLPGRLKQALSGALLESTRGTDVWDLTAAADGDAVVASGGDLLVVDGRDGPPQVHGPHTLHAHPDAAARWIVRPYAETSDAAITVDTPAGRVTAAVLATPRGRYVHPRRRTNGAS